MKIIETIYEYRYQPNEIISYFKNRIWKVFWRHNTAKTSEAYYQINREISDNVDEMFYILNADFYMSRELFEHHVKERTEALVKERLSQLISQELFKSDKIFVTQYKSIYGDLKYKVSIPFLNRVLEKDVNSDS